MAFMTNVLSGFFFVVFSYWLVTARTRRQVLAAVLAGVLVVALVGPPQAQAQGTRPESRTFESERSFSATTLPSESTNSQRWSVRQPILLR
jgi:hypothetical protein